MSYFVAVAAGLAIGHRYIPPTLGLVAVASPRETDLGGVILLGAIVTWVSPKRMTFRA